MVVDVVAEPAAHQINLSPPSHPPSAAIIALALPRICAWLAPEVFARHRAAALAALAARVGGGDGPAPIYPVEEIPLGDDRGAPDGGDLDARLAALFAAGIRRVAVYGAADQPGVADRVVR